MNLNPWDIPNDTFATRVEEGGTIRWDSRDWQILLFLNGASDWRTLAVRRLDLGLSSPLWRVATRALSVNFHAKWHPEKSNLGKEELVSVALEEGRLRQRYYMGANLDVRQQGMTATTCFDLSPLGIGGLCPVQADDEDEPFTSLRTFFSWPDQPEHFAQETDALRWWRTLQQEWGNPESDATFALHFAEMSFSQKRDLLWKWKNGSFEAAHEAFRLALLSANELCESASSWDWIIHLPLPEEERHGILWSSQMQGIHEANPSLPLQLSAERINSYFAPTTTNEQKRNSLCVQEWQAFYPLRFRIQIQAPTMHERIEAALRWREWLASTEEFL